MTTPALPAQTHLAYRDGELLIEDVRLHDLAQAHGTPLFVYSKATMLAALAAYQRGFAGRKCAAGGRGLTRPFTAPKGCIRNFPWRWSCQP